MGNRYLERRPVNERVELWSGHKKCGDFETENMCPGGIFVKDCQNEISGVKTLTIKFSSNPNLSYKASHEAAVVHKGNNGVGFRWTSAHRS